jgi:hypothetical protein
VFDMRQTGAPIATLKGPSCNPIHTLQHVPEHSRLAEQGESVKETSGLLSASCSSLCFWSDIGSSNPQTDGYRQAHLCKILCKNLFFSPVISCNIINPGSFLRMLLLLYSTFELVILFCHFLMQANVSVTTSRIFSLCLTCLQCSD